METAITCQPKPGKGTISQTMLHIHHHFFLVPFTHLMTPHYQSQAKCSSVELFGHTMLFLACGIKKLLTNIFPDLVKQKKHEKYFNEKKKTLTLLMECMSNSAILSHLLP